MPSEMTYAGSGVDYGAMDPFKRRAQRAALDTAHSIRRLNNGEFKEYARSRGESAYLIEAAKSYFVHVEEGLGTKNLVADAMYRLTGRSYYDHVAQCTVAMIVNDMATLGGLPLSVAMHLAVGDSAWFDDERRSGDLIDGWRTACLRAGAAWGGGETPTLKGIVNPDTVVLSGSAMGIIKPKERLLSPDNIRHGDAILLLSSSGVHANGLSLCRQIADKLPNGYLTRLPGGRTYGDTLLDPTTIYVRFVELCIDKGVRVSYAVNITGHGWRKLMRAPGAFSYVIDRLPPQQHIFDFIQEHGPVTDREAYGNFNMGAGFALYVHPEDVSLASELLTKGWQIGDYPAVEMYLTKAGFIEESSAKRVVIRPKDLEYSGEELQVR